MNWLARPRPGSQQPESSSRGTFLAIQLHSDLLRPVRYYSISFQHFEAMSVQVLKGTKSTTTQLSSSQSFNGNCLRCTSSMYVAGSAPHNVDCTLLRHGIVSNSSYFELLLSNVDPAYLIKCICHDSLRVDVYAIQNHLN